MTITIVTVLELLAFGCFVAAAIGLPSRINLIAAGLACWVLTFLITV